MLGKDYKEGGMRFQDFIGLELILECLNKYSKDKRYKGRFNFETNKNAEYTSNFDDIEITEEKIRRFQVKQKSELSVFGLEQLCDVFLNDILKDQKVEDDFSQNYLVVGISSSCSIGCDILEEITNQNYVISPIEQVFEFKDISIIEPILNDYYNSKCKNAKKHKDEYTKLLKSDYTYLKKFKVIIIKTTWFEITSGDDLFNRNIDRLLVQHEFYERALKLLPEGNSSALKEIMLYLISIVKTNFKNNQQLSEISILYDYILEKINLKKYIRQIDQNIPIDKNKYIYRQEYINDVLNYIKKDNIIFIQGTPGCGKTFFTRALIETLEEENYLVYKHYLYINKSDLNKTDRIEKEQIFFTINSQISESFPGLISRLGNSISDLKKALNEISSESTKKIVLIIDGLDHLNREESATKANLNEIINEFKSLATEQIIIIFLTQPLLEFEDKKLTIGNFSEDEAKTFLSFYNLDDDLCRKILSNTDRNPLLLHYLAEDGRSQFDNFPTDLNEYYDILYNENSKDLINYVVVGQNYLDYEDLKQLSNLSDVVFNDVLNDIYHVLIEVKYPFKTVMFFHESFKVFVFDKQNKYYRDFSVETNKIMGNILDYFLKLDNLKAKIYLPFLIVENGEYDKYNYSIDIIEHFNDVMELYINFIDLDKYYNALSKIYLQTQDYESLYRVSYLNTSYETFTNNFSSIQDALYLYLYYTKGIEYVNFVMGKSKFSQNEFGIRFCIEVLENGLTEFFNGDYRYYYTNDDIFGKLEDLDFNEKNILIETITYLIFDKNNYYKSTNSSHKRILGYILGEEPDFKKNSYSNDKWFYFDSDFYIIQYIFNKNKFETNHNKKAEKWLINLYKCLSTDHTFIEFKEKYNSECNIYITHIFFDYTNFIIPILILKSKYNSEIIEFLIDEILDYDSYNFKNQYTEKIIKNIFDILTYGNFEINSDFIKRFVKYDYKNIFITEESSNSEVLKFEIDKAIILKKYLGIKVDLNELQHYHSYGSYRDSQIRDLISVAKMLVENDADNLYEKIFKLVEMSFYATEIMERAKDVWDVPYEIINIYYKKDKIKAMIMIAHFYKITDFKFNYAEMFTNEILNDFLPNVDDELKLLGYYTCLLNSNRVKYICEIWKIEGFETEKDYVIKEYIDKNLKENIFYYKSCDIPYLDDFKEIIKGYTINHFKEINNTNDKYSIEDKDNAIEYSDYLIKNWEVILNDSTVGYDFYFRFTSELDADKVDEIFLYKLNSSFFDLWNYSNFILKNKNLIADLGKEARIKLLIIIFVNSYGWRRLDNIRIMELAIEIDKDMAKTVLKECLKCIDYIPPQGFILEYLIEENLKFCDEILQIYEYRLPRLVRTNIEYSPFDMFWFNYDDALNILFMMLSDGSMRASNQITYSTLLTFTYQQFLNKIYSWINTDVKICTLFKTDFLDDDSYLWLENMYMSNDFLHEDIILKNYWLNLNYKDIEIIKFENHVSGWRIIEGIETLNKYNLRHSQVCSLLNRTNVPNDVKLYISYVTDDTYFNDQDDENYRQTKMKDQYISELTYYFVRN